MQDNCTKKSVPRIQQNLKIHHKINQILVYYAFALIVKKCILIRSELDLS